MCVQFLDSDTGRLEEWWYRTDSLLLETRGNIVHPDCPYLNYRPAELLRIGTYNFGVACITYLVTGIARENVLAVLYAREIVQNGLSTLVNDQPQLVPLIANFFGDEKSLLSFLLLTASQNITLPFFSLSKGTEQRNQIPIYNQENEPGIVNASMMSAVDKLMEFILEAKDRCVCRFLVARLTKLLSLLAPFTAP